MPKFILVPKAGQNDFEVSESIKQNIIRQCELAIKTAPDNVIIPNEVWVELSFLVPQPKRNCSFTLCHGQMEFAKGEIV